MMETMRKAAKSWVAKVLIGLLAISFGVWGIADVFRGSSTGALATVGDQDISPEQFNHAFREYLKNYSRQTGKVLTPEEARSLGIDHGILTSLLQSAALNNEVNHLKLNVSDTFLAHDVMRNPNFLDSSGKFDSQRFKLVLEQNGLSEQGFFAEVRQNMMQDALRSSATDNVAVGQGLLEAQYRYDNEQRDARFFIVTTQDSEAAAPTDDEIKKEYETNPAAYTAPEYRSIAVMKVEPADIASKITLTDQDVTDGYEKYKAEYFTPEKRTILQISFPTLEEAQAAKTKLAAGTDFLALAKERGFNEQDVTFADKTKGEFLDPAVADAAFALTEGQVSEPVKGALSTVLLKAVKISPEKQSTLDEVKAKLSDRLKLERAGEEIDSIYNAVEDARAAQTPFEEIAKKAGIPFELIAPVDAQGNDKDGKPVAMPHPKELLNAAYASDVGVENDAISLDNGYVWYEVREVVPSALKPLEQVKDKARAAVVASKVRAISEEKAKKMVERARSGVKLEDLAKEANAEIKTEQGLRRRESGANFGPAAMAALFAVADNGFAYALEPDGRGARVIQSQPVLLPAFDPASADAKAIGDKLKGQVADNMLNSYLAALQKEAGVNINDQIWRNIAGQTN